MKRPILLLALIIAAMGVFIVLQARSLPERPAEPPAPRAAVESAAAPAASPGGGTSSAGEAGLVSVRSSAAPPPRRDLAEIQRRLADGERGTYVREIFLQREDNNARWPDRQAEPLRVWIQPTSPLADFQSSYPVRAREAFERWARAGLPVSFVFVRDSTSCDIPVVWVDKFDIPISGRTKWTRDQYWWIINASIEVALHHQSGAPLDPTAIYAITLHEVGHVLGLDHTQDDRSIMAARVRVTDLADVDEHTAQMIYSIPPGSVVKP